MACRMAFHIPRKYKSKKIVVWKYKQWVNYRIKFF